MPSIEQTVKQQFARLFVTADWHLFKQMAEFYLRRAVHLKKADFAGVQRERKLLVRNSVKRLFIGIATELLLKAIYLKHGYRINRIPPGPNAPAFPFTPEQAAGFTLLAAETYMLDSLITGLQRVLPSAQGDNVQRGLKIAKVFRNKEGHTVAPKHTHVAQNYRDIESSLIALYSAAFGEHLQVRFSVRHHEKGVWNVKTTGLRP